MAHIDKMPDWFFRRTRMNAKDWQAGWGPMPEVKAEPFDPENPKPNEWWARLEFDDPATRREWRVHVRFFLREGRAECGEVRLADRDGKGVSADDMRKFPWGSMISDLRSDLAEQYFRAVGAQTWSPKFVERGASEGKLAEVADLYRSAVKEGNNPTQAVTHFYGVTRSTASRWISTARTTGLLGAAIPGRAGEAEGS